MKWFEKVEKLPNQIGEGGKNSSRKQGKENESEWNQEQTGKNSNGEIH